MIHDKYGIGGFVGSVQQPMHCHGDLSVQLFHPRGGSDKQLDSIRYKENLVPVTCALLIGSHETGGQKVAPNRVTGIALNRPSAE